MTNDGIDACRSVVATAQPPGPHLAFASGLVESMVVPTFVLDSDGVVRIWNRACENLTGVPASEVVGTREHWRGFYENARPCLCDLVLHDRLDEFETYYTARASSQDHNFGVHAENWCVMPRIGRNLYLAIDVGAVFDPQGRLVAVVETLRDMTVQKQAQDSLARLASQDALTGLSNRREFDDRLAYEWHRARRERSSLSLLMLDVDFFKQYNDLHGHPAGDQCLRTIGHALRTAVSRMTDLVARYGGEEFAVILPQTELRAAGNVAERLRGAVARARVPRGEPGRGEFVTISIGAARAYPAQEGGDERALVERSDQALYQAKKAGRNRVALSQG